MNLGDTVTATWTDGYQVVGVYVRMERGYHILLDLSENREVVCNPTCVSFQVGDHVKSEPLQSKSKFPILVFSIAFLLGFGVAALISL